MMRWLLWLLAVFAAAVALALAGRTGEGIVVVTYPPWRVETSLLLAILGLLAFFAVLYLATRLVGHTLALPSQVRAFWGRRKREQAQAALAAALQGYFEGRYSRAEREAEIAWRAGISRGLAALIAARASHQLREFERRDQWLERAEREGEALHTARLLTQAELLLEERDFVGARDALRSLHGTGPRHLASARMLLRAERGAHNWEEVLRLASLLAKRGAVSPTVAEEHRVQAYIELLAREGGDRASLEARLRHIPSVDLAHPRVAAAAARKASALGDTALARALIEKSLAAEWTAGLVLLYCEIPGMESQKVQEEARARIERAERWLRERAEDPQLLAALGTLCAKAELWGKAQNYLEASLSFGETRAAHLELARLAERDNRPAEAQKHFRRAAELP
ncbi:MAG TPA: heme biosynthesis HemY N-terminal domain-containing protein [Burkholderiales bacterium]|jgi:HemY protein|nr:heme biosynthesis HemY N-terminal domain-containing protein [Burkholderiales bacterium]